MAVFKIKKKEYMNIQICKLHIGKEKAKWSSYCRENGRFAFIWRVNLHAILGADRNKKYI